MVKLFIVRLMRYFCKVKNRIRCINGRANDLHYLVRLFLGFEFISDFANFYNLDLRSETIFDF